MENKVPPASLVTFGTCHPIRETLLPRGNLEGFGQGMVDPRLQVEYIRKSPLATVSDTLVSTSLFSSTGCWDGKWNYDSFNRALPAPRAKYWDALVARRQDYPTQRLRIYLDYGLRGMATPLLNEVGVDEVAIMRTAVPGMVGMLWRYLPLLEPEFSWVFCSGVDGYDNTGAFARYMVDPQGRTLKASVWMNRHWMPFAGPIAASPAWVAEAYHASGQMDDYLTGFLTLLTDDQLVEKAKAHSVLRTIRHGGKLLPWVDAGFLTVAFWNQALFEGWPGFASQVFHAFHHVEMVSLNLGLAR